VSVVTPPVQTPAFARTDAVVEPYDFRRPMTLAREHSRVLELAFETFARQWATQLTAKVRVLSQVTCEQVVMLTYDEYASRLPQATAMVLCALSDTAPKGVIQFPMSAALAWVTSMLGGSSGVQAPERTFTPIEHALIRRLMDDALEDLRYSLGPLLVAAIRVDAIQYNSQFAQAAATNEPIIVATFALHVGESVCEATLALPASALLPQLGDAYPASTTADARELVTAQLTRVPVDVSLRLEPAAVRPSTILNLAVGDVLPLPHPRHRPLDVAVDGHTVATAALGASGSRLAGVVVSTKDDNA